MDTFTVRDLRERTGKLIHDAEAGHLSLVTKHGRPVFIAVPFSEDILKYGLRSAMAIKLYDEEVVTLRTAAKIAGDSLSAFIDKLGALKIPVVRYSAEELDQELKNIE